MTHAKSARWLATLGFAALSAGCPQTPTQESRPADAAINQSAPAANGGVQNPTKPRKQDSTCVRGGACVIVDPKPVDQLDLLFSIANTESMADEQQALKAQLPALFSALSGISSLHVGVVSSDMGVPGIELGICDADGGDDGRLQSTPRGPTCESEYPGFLRYAPGMQTTPEQFAGDVSCIAMLGTGGCGLEMSLEAPFKALWPSVQRDRAGQVVMPNEFRFISTTELGTFGKGDLGDHQGFLRDDSLLAVVVLTDADDCSVRQTSQFIDESATEQSVYDKRYLRQRCLQNQQHTFDVEERYLQGFRKLRPDRESRVVFAAIAGVPADLVDSDARAATDFADGPQRAAFYDKILTDRRMQGAVSCSWRVSDQSAPSQAHPPRRLLKLAKAFGAEGLVQSVCQDDLSDATAALTGLINDHLGESCLERPLAREAGKVSCDVIWELPAASSAGATVPTKCDARPFLSAPVAPRAARNAGGGLNCVLSQVAVANSALGAEPPAEGGWYYDDFSHNLQDTCQKHLKQRIAFTPDAAPPEGVRVVLDCER